MSLGAKEWLTRIAKTLGIAAVIWVIAWFWGGVNFSFGVVAVAFVLGIVGTLIT